MQYRHLPSVCELLSADFFKKFFFACKFPFSSFLFLIYLD